jgi:hypothetical protein
MLRLVIMLFILIYSEQMDKLISFSFLSLARERDRI